MGKFLRKLSEGMKKVHKAAKENRIKREAAIKARTKAKVEAALKGKPAVKPVKPVSTQPATSAKPVAVTPK